MKYPLLAGRCKNDDIRNGRITDARPCAGIFATEWKRKDDPAQTFKAYDVVIERMFGRADGTKGNTNAFGYADLDKVAEVSAKAKQFLAQKRGIAEREADRTETARSGGEPQVG